MTKKKKVTPDVPVDGTVFTNAKALTKEADKKEPVILVIYGESTGKSFKLNKDKPTFVGRSTELDIVLSDAGISRKHAQVNYLSDGGVILIDLNSTNGTFVNGEKIEEKRLSEGDKVQIGSAAIVKFSYQDSLEEKYQQSIYESATLDSLTKSYNKKFFLDNLEKEFSFAKRGSITFSLIIFDIDHFKKINDTHGHQAGDYILKNLATVIKKATRQEDVLCRYGGEEFTIILRGINAEKSLLLGDRLRKAVEIATFEFEGKKIKVTISVGITTMTKANFESMDDMIKKADGYLYKAKENGRNRVESELTE